MKTLVFGDKNSKHLYAVEVKFPNGAIRMVDVHASDAKKARLIAEKFGVIVRSVNMIG